MCCFSLRGFAFLTMVLAALAVGRAVAENDSRWNGSSSGQIQVIEPGIEEPDRRDIAKESSAAMVISPTRRAPTPAKQATVEAKTAEKSAAKASSDESSAPVAKSAKASSDPLRPIPKAEENAAPVAIEATSFKGVIPGVSTREAVAKAWGEPKQSLDVGGSLVQLFTLKPFNQVEAHYSGDRVASIVIRLERSFPAEVAAKQLDLIAIRSVLVSNEKGEVLGAAYPERGVLFAFDPSDKPGRPSMKVSQIILEPVSAEAFVLRAETAMESRLDLSRRDLEQALALEPGNARAQWLYSRVSSAVEQYDKALKASSEAVRIEPDNPQYLVTHAQDLARAGQLRAAAEEAQRAAAIGADRPHVKARAICLLGDLLASGAKPDFKKSLGLHMQAIQTAEPLASNPHPAIRVAAKEVLISAHLGAAHDIAWGEWKEKPKAVTRWLERAATLAEELVANDGASAEQLFHVHTRTLAAYVGVRGKLDPAPIAKAAVEVGNKLIAASRDPLQKAQLQWELGMALYDAVQICQMRSESAAATKHGEAAAGYLAAAIETNASASRSFQLGRLYFRLGMIHAMRGRAEDHQIAVTWYEKALPLLDRMTPDELADGLGRHGEAMATMGVSYWKTGAREKAVAMTQKGVGWMEQAVKQGAFDRASLSRPYGNLAAMHRDLGDDNQADRFERMASRAKTDNLK